MRFVVTAILFVLTLGTTAVAHAGQAEVRDVALTNNCPPKKTEIYTQSLGADGSTVYRVQCAIPKTVGTPESSSAPPDSLLISCKQNLCEMLRPVTAEKK